MAMIAYAFPAILALFFVFKLVRLIKNIDATDKSIKWKETTGKVKDARITNQESKVIKKINISNVHFFATYEVNGISFGTEKISIIESSMPLLRKTLRDLGDKKECKIYYDSKKPHVGVLVDPSKHVFFWSYLQLVILLLITIISFVLI